MIIQTEEDFFERFSKMSKILNPEENKRPGKIWMLDVSKQGLEAMLRERLDPENGSLVWARKKVSQTLAEWDDFNSRAVKPAPKPVGEFLRKITESKAKTRVVEAECRRLNQMLTELSRKEEEAKQRKIDQQRMNGQLKYRDGVPFLCDGRELVRDEQGGFVFIDEPTLTLEAYLENVKERKKAQTVAKRSADAQGALERARKRLPPNETAQQPSN